MKLNGKIMDFFLLHLIYYICEKLYNYIDTLFVNQYCMYRTFVSLSE